MSVIFSTLMTWLLGLFGRYAISLTARIAIGVAFVSLLVASILAYLQAASVLISGIGMTVPDVVAGVWGWVMPYNTNYCLVAISSVYVLRFFTYQYFLMLNARFRVVVASGI